MKPETDHPNTGKERDKREENSGNGEYLRQSSKTKVNLGRLGRPPRPDAGNVLCTIVFQSSKQTASENHQKHQVGQVDHFARVRAPCFAQSCLTVLVEKKKAERKERDNKEKEAREQRKRKRGKGKNEKEGRTSKERDSKKARKQGKKEKTRTRKQ